MASDKIQILTDSSFDQSIKASTTPVLVDFWAEWCAPCRRIAPTVEALATELEGKLAVGKMNVDENPNIPTRYGIRGIPTLLLFKAGELVDSIVGLVAKEDIKKMIERHL
jgi:thioredoxin 1